VELLRDINFKRYSFLKNLSVAFISEKQFMKFSEQDFETTTIVVDNQFNKYLDKIGRGPFIYQGKNEKQGWVDENNEKMPYAVGSVYKDKNGNTLALWGDVSAGYIWIILIADLSGAQQKFDTLYDAISFLHEMNVKFAGGGLMKEGMVGPTNSEKQSVINEIAETAVAAKYDWIKNINFDYLDYGKKEDYILENLEYFLDSEYPLEDFSDDEEVYNILLNDYELICSVVLQRFLENELIEGFLKMKRREIPDSKRGEYLVDASIIDYPRKTLDPQLWNLSQETPILHSSVKDRIVTTLHDGLKSEFTEVIWSSEIKNINLTGSIGTYSYNPESDIDIHIILDDYKKLDNTYGEGFVDAVQEFVRGESMSGWTIGDHPVNYYIQTDNKQDMKGDALYNVSTDTWVIAPSDTDITEDPYSKYEPLWEKSQDWMKLFNNNIMELQRDIQDVEELQTWLKELDEEELGWLEDRIEDKVEEVNKDLDDLAKEFTDVHEQRNEAYDTDLEQAFEDFSNAKASGRAGNVVWKFLEKYGLVVILSGLRHISEELTLDDEAKVEKSKEFLEKFNLMFEKLM